MIDVTIRNDVFKERPIGVKESCANLNRLNIKSIAGVKDYLSNNGTFIDTFIHRFMCHQITGKLFMENYRFSFI